jgi:Mg2+ and Co2+ transporter CorA
LYGMNVDLPAQHSIWIFWRLLWGMIWLTIVTMIYFKWKKWF